jgi:crotonobetainyl-CoA:carnitine CoA-transferase CaiB-like acyl-CoA transferase
MEGIRVLEVGTFWAAPLVGRYLAQLGAQVTALVRPDDAPSAQRERARLGPSRDALRAHKRVVPCALPDDLAVALEMVREVDVLVENFAPGTLDRLGLSYEACVARNPNLVYVSLPGFASDDPEFADVKAYESVVMAAAGVFRDMGRNRTLLGVQASYTPLPLASVYTSMHAAYAIVAALLHREHSPLERKLVLPLASCLAETMVHNSMHYKVDRCYMDARERRLADGDYPIDARTLAAMLDPFFQTYDCAEGTKFYLVCPAHRRHQRAALDVLGVDASLVPTVDPYKGGGGVHGLGSGSLSDEQAAVLRPRMAAAFLAHPAREWERRLGRAGVPGAAHRTTDEWRREATHLVDPSTGDLAPPAWLEDAHTLLPGPLPLVARHAGSPRSLLPLSGVVVVDACNVIAGPTIGYLLARLGAQVVKVDPPKPTYAPEVAVLYGLAANRGKRSVLLDVHADRHAFERLVRKADVLLVNCTAPCLARMRLTPADVRRINPRCVLARFDAWSGPTAARDRMDEYNGYDDCVQAALGIMTRFGGGPQSPEEHAHVGTIDVVAGVAGALGVAAALYERCKRGVVHVARASLAAVGQYLQFPFYYAPQPSCGRGPACVGEHAGLRFYQTTDGAWVLVVLPFGDVHAAPHVDVFAKVRARVKAVGGEVVRLRSMCEVRDAYRWRPSSTFAFDAFHDHPIGTLVLVRAHALRGLPTCASLEHAPQYGAHTKDVLGFAAPPWSRTYLPSVAACECCGATYDEDARRFELPCAHFACRSCASLDACLLCGALHGVAAWRADYAGWRRGQARGAHGEPAPRRAAVGMARSHSCPVVSSMA